MAFRWAISTRMKFTPRPPGTIFKDEWSAETGGNKADLEIEANRRYALNHPRRAFKTLRRWNDGPWIREPSNAAKANPMDFALRWSASKFEGHRDDPYVPNATKTAFLNRNAFVAAGTTSELQHSLPALGYGIKRIASELPTSPLYIGYARVGHEKKLGVVTPPGQETILILATEDWWTSHSPPMTTAQIYSTTGWQPFMNGHVRITSTPDVALTTLVGYLGQGKGQDAWISVKDKFWV